MWVGNFVTVAEAIVVAVLDGTSVAVGVSVGGVVLVGEAIAVDVVVSSSAIRPESESV